VFGMRVAVHFGGPAISYDTYDYPGDAATALDRLDEVYAAWTAGARSLDADALARPIGPAEPYFADEPMAALILHINREALHHGAEIALLRDLYRWEGLVRHVDHSGHKPRSHLSRFDPSGGQR
jgi:hypothetical protein